MDLPRATLQSGRLKALDILAELTEGYYGQPGWPLSTLGELQLQPTMDKFRIMENTYHLYNLRGPRSVLVLDSTKKYVLLNVPDNSMERVGLLEGDYALVRLQPKDQTQLEAQTGDIAVVKFSDPEPWAVLRTFAQQEDEVIFRSQSANLNEPAFEFPRSATNLYQVFGIVLGVFKPAMPVPVVSIEEWADSNWTTTAMPAQASEEPTPWPGDVLQTLPVYAEIPAGGPKAVPKVTGTPLEVECFTIEGERYYLKNLRGQGRVINPGSGKTIVLKVTGDSMNQAGIRDGEYVLLRRQDGAVDGDIVAVELRGEDDLATLKRYRERNGKIVLQPESDNPAYQEREFSWEEMLATGTPQPFFIQGVALGVFKQEL
jgi:SOS-response transcriptional repressor LexA